MVKRGKKKKSSAPRWRREQQAKKKKEKKAQVLLGVIFLISIFLLVAISWLWQKSKDSVWDGRSNIRVIEQKGEELRLVSFFPKEKRWLSLKIPGNSLSLVPSGYGDYQLNKVYSLGKLEDKGGWLLLRSVENLMGLPVEGWQVEGETNLSWWDELRWWWNRYGVRSKSVEINLEENPAWEADRLKDGSQVYRVKQGLLDDWVNKEFFETKLAEEGLSVAVLNASGVEGGAKTVARIIANLGGEVVLVANLEEDKQVSASYILVNSQEKKDSLTVERLRQILRIDEVLIGETAEYRAEILAVLGEDYN